jgi:uncharacterized membrane protein YciS (DUF1049 family)
MKKMYRFIMVVVICIIAATIGCNNTKKVEDVNVMIPKSIPLIDSNKPLKNETATFALG